MSQPLVTLVPCSPNDAQDLASLRVLAMRPSLERLGRFDLDRARERFLLGFSAVHTRLVMVDGDSVGFVAVRPCEDELLLDHLYIHPENQGKGLGGFVLGIVFAEADAQGKSIRVGALKESDSNRFYVRNSFKLVDEAEWDNYYVRQVKSAPCPSR